MKKTLVLGFLIFTSLLWSQQGVNILIKTNSPGAAVLLDGNFTGVTGPDGNKIIKKVPQGKHEIKISKDGYFESRRIITVSELSNTFNFTMKKIPGYRPNVQKKDSGVQKTGKGSSQNLEIFLIIMVIIVLAIVVFMMAWIIRNSKKQGIIGKFELLRIIGKGGIATTYKAKDLVKRKIIALKVLDPLIITDQDMVDKFFRESNAISKINREFPDAPIVKVTEFGQDMEKSLGIPYIAMEYVKGDDLLKMIKQYGNIPVTRKLYIAREVSRGLKVAHKLGIFHGDITPDNIIVDGDKVTLIDFGVSRHLDYDNDNNKNAFVMGKPLYMSPEQCAGDPVGEKSDVYSLGVILFFMFYGRPPFISKNPGEVMNMHKQNPLPDLNTPFPGEIKELIYRMLDKDPQKRPGTTELEETLEKLIREYEVK